MVDHSSDRDADLAADTKAACGMAGRPDHVRPALLPLLGGDPLGGDASDIPLGIADDDDPDQLAAVRGIFFWTLMSVTFWTLLAAVWFLF